MSHTSLPSPGGRRWLATPNVLSVLFILTLLFAGEAPAPILALLYAAPGGLTSGACDDWSVACELRYALSVATTPGYVYNIYVEEGTYKPINTSDRTASFNLHNGVAIYGGYASTPDHTRDPAAHVSILSGDLNGDDGPNFTNNSDNSYHVVSSSATDSTAILDGFTIKAGYANVGGNYDGGGVWNDGSPTLTHLIISANAANSTGGGMYNGYGGTPTLSDVTFIGNAANLGGGLWTYASVGLTRVTFSGNYANQDGGGVYNQTYDAALADVTFYNNYAYDGGAMYNHDGYPQLTHVTFNNNHANHDGGALYSTNGGSVAASLINVILWGDSATNGNEVYRAGGKVSIDHSVVGGGCPSSTNCTNLITADPKLDSLASNGGFTQTMALGADSSAVDTGDDTTCTNPPVNGLDQRGVPRPQGPHCDIGAFETIYYTISGNAGIAGSAINYTGDTTGSTVANGSGNYSFSVPSGWSGTVTPSKTNYTFAPVSRTYSNLTADQSGQNYIASTPLRVMAVYPPDGSQACRRPPVGVDLQFVDELLTSATLDPSAEPLTLDRASIHLTLDGVDKTDMAFIVMTMTHPASYSVLYIPTTDLAVGAHQGRLIYPSATVLTSRIWNFTVANIACISFTEAPSFPGPEQQAPAEP